MNPYFEALIANQDDNFYVVKYLAPLIYIKIWCCRLQSRSGGQTKLYFDPWSHTTQRVPLQGVFIGKTFIYYNSEDEINLQLKSLVSFVYLITIRVI